LKYYYDDSLIYTVNDNSQNFGHCPNSNNCIDTVACAGDISTCVFGRVPHIREFIILCSEIPPGSTATTNAYGPSPCGLVSADANCSTSGFGPYGDSTNPKMTVAYVNHYKYVTPAVTDLQGLTCTQWGIQFGWTAPAGEADNSNVASYEIRCSSSPIDDSNWNGATICTLSGAPGPVTPGTQQTQWVTGLSSCSWHYFAVRSKDAAGNWSATSNNSYCRTKCTTNGPCLLDPSAQRLPSPEESLPFGINRVSPNPATSGLEIEYTLTSSAKNAELALFDLAGRRVAVLDRPRTAVGTRTLQWNLENSQGARVRAGTYWLRLASNGVKRTKMVVVQ